MTQSTNERPKRKAEFIRPQPLAGKVPRMGGLAQKEALQRAEQAVAVVAQEFETLLEEELVQLDKLMLEYKENPSSDVLDRVFRKVHNLRGQGTTMGFPLVTRIGTSFCAYIIERNMDRPLKQALIQQHLQALHIVLRQKKANDGDAVSLQVAAALEEAVARELA